MFLAEDSSTRTRRLFSIYFEKYFTHRRSRVASGHHRTRCLKLARMQISICLRSIAIDTIARGGPRRAFHTPHKFNVHLYSSSRSAAFSGNKFVLDPTKNGLLRRGGVRKGETFPLSRDSRAGIFSGTHLTRTHRPDSTSSYAERSRNFRGSLKARREPRLVFEPRLPLVERRAKAPIRIKERH